LVVAGETRDFVQSVDILLGNGDGTFQPAQSNPLGSLAVSVAVADVNNDGRLDIAALGSNGPSIFLGNGDGSFQAGQSYTAGVSPRAVDLGGWQGEGMEEHSVAHRRDAGGAE